ncbi:methyltransferase domain-containing protein [Aggregicoccus sp. 17bor-14]|uniref:methyltransferase n=1 Tax=Myxococcaceae TaxID=31 RepID=UPI00129D0F1C|nr:methyltransferase domain-containing protein [Simulacricoccus sp. 17bor-14]MRI88794.1 methyltransferase domain-containing protein [Aggregicoccus sp. 17bor-14]
MPSATAHKSPVKSPPAGPTVGLSRVELYRLLADPGRLQLLALCAAEALSVGELAAVLRDSQPQVSRRAAPLRQAGLLSARRDGTRTWLEAELGEQPLDPVLADALAEGQRLCREDGSLARMAAVVAAREERGQAFFEAAPAEPAASAHPTHLAPLAALAPLLPGRALAVDVGAGDGPLLDVLAPLYGQVLAVERSRARLAACAARVAERGYANVGLIAGSYEDPELARRVSAAGGADLVFASRILHHASRPTQALASFARLLKPGGHLVVLDYAPHEDDEMREAQADVWLGFSPAELAARMGEVGLEVVAELPIPAPLHPGGEDAHLAWHAVVARAPLSQPSLSTPH